MSRQSGYLGEQIAVSYLLKKRYKIRQCNYTIWGGEIDIVAETEDDIVVFVEVKRYKVNSVVHPLESITAYKQKKLKKTGLFYITAHQLKDIQIRFDVIIVENEQVKDHLEDFMRV
ncbi:MAG: YraN family protein [Candidatus Margulisbacteria bacterium]|nr:YraN family protein [Candidatus Margulisiibacteriota bacterium]